MAGFAGVTLLGNLTRAPDLRFLPSGTAIVKFCIASNKRWKNSAGEWCDKAVFVDVTMFGKRAEAFEKYHAKGDKAFISGSLDFDQWEDKNTGQKRSKLYVIGDSWEFVGSKNDVDPAVSAPSGNGEVSDTPF